MVHFEIIRFIVTQPLQPLPPDKRLIVVATNVAETSVTLPDVRYVVDR
jgi:ATP-dependent RNA helicase DHX37/DHR1